MFSGIVESTARVVALEREQGNLHLTLTCPFARELSIDQSVAHNGVCLTVVRLGEIEDICDEKEGCSSEGSKLPTYTVTAIDETLRRSNLGDLSVGDEVNVERSMQINARLDGHIVQGHVDETATCIDRREADGSTIFTFEYPRDDAKARQGYLTVEKGSVTVNGVSLTVCEPTATTFSVCIIPYTLEHTNFHAIRRGTRVNLEFDIIGKYICRLAALGVN